LGLAVEMVVGLGGDAARGVGVAGEVAVVVLNSCACGNQCQCQQPLGEKHYRGELVAL